MTTLLPPPQTTEKAPLHSNREGQSRADSTLRFEYIVKIKEGLETLYADNPNVLLRVAYSGT